MKKKFGLSSLKDKAKDIANSDRLMKGINAVQEMKEDIKQSEVFSQVAGKANEIKESDVYCQAKETVQIQVEKVSSSTIVQNAAQKSSDLSRQVQETGKETFSNAKKKLQVIVSPDMSLSVMVGQERKLHQKEKHDFLYACKKAFNNFDPFEIIVLQAETIAKHFDGYYGDELPYGRIMAFNKSENSNLDAVAFLPKASKDLYEMKEYGITINTNSILVKFEVNNSVNLLGKDFQHSKVPNIEECIYFDRIEDVKKNENTLQISFFDMDEQLKVLTIHDKYKSMYFNESLGKLLRFASKFNYSDTYQLQQSLSEDDYDLPSAASNENKAYLMGGVHQSLSGKLDKNISDIDYAYHEAKNYPQGGGYYAEYLNAELLNTMTTKVEMVAKSNPKQKSGTGDNAADFKITNRLTGSYKMVQLKYKSSPRELARDIMKYDNPVMIPPDKYVETMKLLKNDPEFQNVSKEKIKSVMKGRTPYDLTIGLNKSLPKKLGVDIGLSAKQALTPTLVTVGSTALLAVWKGEEPKKAIQNSLQQGKQSFVISTAIGSASKIAGRISATRLAKTSIDAKTKAAQKTAKNVGKAATVVMITVSVVPDLTNAINGKISKQQLAKILITTGAGLVGGAAGGGVASIPLAILATEVTAQLYDKYVKDDVLINYQIYKEGFIDLVNKYQLAIDDVNVIVEETFANPTFNEHLLELQNRCQGYTKAKCAFVYEHLELLVNRILSQRKPISEESLAMLNDNNYEDFSVTLADS